MYYRHILLSTCVFITAAGAAANISLVDVVKVVPPCGVGCMSLEKFFEIVEDPAVLCENTTLQLSVSTCLQKRCNYTEQVRMSGLNTRVCDGFPIDTRAWSVALSGIVCGPLALIAVAVRFYTRITITKELGIDDWLILGSAGAIAALTGLGIHNCVYNGFGRHLWDIDPIRGTHLQMIFYACELLYLLCMTLTKASILVFYLRIFQSTWFWRANIALLVFVGATGVATCTSTVFQCNPIAGVWDQGITSQCLNVNALAFASGGIIVATDVAIVILPIPELVNLRMNWRKKLGIITMFSLGSLACITSIVRLKYMVKFATSLDKSYDNSHAVIWTFLELSVAIICACLPALRGFISKFLPNIFETSRSKNEIPTPKSPTHPTTPLTQLSRFEKTGPSYNKWVTSSSRSPTSPTFNFESQETKIWINPRFDDSGKFLAANTMKSEFNENGRIVSQVPSQDTSLWVLEGPRLSEDIGRVLGMGINREGYMDRNSEGRWDKIEDKEDDSEPETLEKGVIMQRFLSSPKVRTVDQKKPKMQRLTMPLPTGQNALDEWS